VLFLLPSIGAAAPNLGWIIATLQATPEGGWVKISGANRFADVWTPPALTPASSSPPTIISRWSSFAWDTTRGDLIVFGGGHANSAGNDVYRWRGTTGLWERASLPSAVTPISYGGYVYYLSSGDRGARVPQSAHTYDGNSFLPQLDRFVTFGGAAFNNGGPFARETTPGSGVLTLTGPYLFDPARANGNLVGGDTGSGVDPSIPGGQMWSNRDAYVSLPSGSDVPRSFVETTTAYALENGRDVLYVTGYASNFPNPILYRYTINDINNPAQDTWQRVGVAWSSCCYQGSGAIDTARNLYVRTNGNGSMFTYWDLRTSGPNNFNVNFNAALGSGSFGSLWVYGMDYDPRRRQFLLWGGGGDVWALSYAGSEPSQTNWSLVRSVSTTREQPPPLVTDFQASNQALPGGILGKWKYIAQLDAFVGLMNPIDGDVWVYKPVGWVNPGTAVVNSRPAVSAGTVVSYVPGGAPVVLHGGVTVTDSDDRDLSGARASITSGLVAGDVLSFTPAPGISGSYANGVLSLSGVASNASYEAVLRTVSFSNPGLTSGGSTRTVSWQVTDNNAGGTGGGAQTSNVVTSTVSVAAGGGATEGGATESINVALQANGGTASASSAYSAGYTPAAVNDGDRRGTRAGNGGYWNDATQYSFPDWVQVSFAGARTINRIDVFSVQDNYLSPVDPTPAMTFTAYGITSFQVQYWNGTAWIDVPGGNITGNTRIWRCLSFAPITTDRIRVLVTGASLDRWGWSRITEIEARTATSSGATCPGGDLRNVALQSAGAVASASSAFSAGYTPAAVNDGDRRGTRAGNGGYWNDATQYSFPDWVQVTFAGARTINRIDVFSVQDNYLSPVEPTPAMTFTAYGITSFRLQYWNGAAWTDVPGGDVSNNNNVWRTFSFAPLTTDRIRVFVNAAALDRWGWSRVVEIEAWAAQ
jgi:hypothetical protein